MNHDQDEDLESLDPVLAAELRELPRSIEPERDLWPAIERRVQVGERPWRREHPWIERAAAGILLAVAAVLLFRLLAPQPAPAPREEVAAAGPAPVVLSAYAETDRALVSVRDELRAMVESRAGELTPETQRLVFENLETIERAMGEIEAAMAKLPAGPEMGELGRTYIAYRQRQIDLLSQVNRAAARL